MQSIAPAPVPQSIQNQVHTYHPFAPDNMQSFRSLVTRNPKLRIHTQILSSKLTHTRRRTPQRMVFPLHLQPPTLLRLCRELIH